MTVKTIGLTRDANHVYRWMGGAPLPSVTSVTAIHDAIGGSDGLTTWAAGIAVDEAMRQLEDGTGIDRQAAIRAIHRARDTGSAVHRAFEALVNGEEYAPPANVVPYYVGVASFLAKYRPQFLAAEQMIANLELGYAGTFDLAAEIEGEPALIDAKTGKVKRSHALQLAAYRDAEFIGKPGDPTKYPLPEFRRFYVLQLREDGYSLVPMTVGDAERQHFRHLLDTYRRIKAWEAQAA